jgi:hypothetical protein
LHERELIADTGCPCHVILGLTDFARLRGSITSNIPTNYGFLLGALLELSMPELGLTTQVDGYGSDAVLATAQRSSPDFAGLAGLPLLRLLEYGGDATAFWVRRAGGPAASAPLTPAPPGT